MNTGIKRTLIALSVAAAFALPATAAFAGNEGPGDGNSSSDSTTIHTYKKFFVGGKVWVDGYVPVTGDAEAVIHDGQGSFLNESKNIGSSNDASVGDYAGQNASGNIGVNVAAGDNNVQANETALAASDASDVFGMAQVYNTQKVAGNETLNKGATNSSTVSGSAFSGASGNVGVNVASGSNNLQKNALAASAASKSNGAAVASIDNSQYTFGNSTGNYGLKTTKGPTTEAAVNLNITLGGKFAGITDQDGNQYLDSWSGALPHPNGSSTGHIDLDNQIQNANDRPQPDNLSSNPEMSNGGGLSFNTAGDISLSGTATGMMPVSNVVWQHTTNTAGISGSAFSSASGNIGVNVASGSNNLQSNILSMAYSAGTVIAPPTGGEQ